MNKLTALRTFANPSLTPTKGTKIFNDRWYQVTMQNTERDIGDGYYLAEGEYVELLPGKAARERREARLNHCNSIVEYSGPVFELFANEYGGEPRSAGFFPSAEAMKVKLEAKKADHDKWVTDCIEEGLRHLDSAAKIASGEVQKMGFDAAWHEGVALECFAVAAAKCNKFRCDFKAVR